MSESKGMSFEQFREASRHRQPTKVRAIRDGLINSIKGKREYKKGDVLEVKLVCSMVFFLPDGESINYFDF